MQISAYGWVHTCGVYVLIIRKVVLSFGESRLRATIQAQALWRPEQNHLPGGKFMVVFSLTQDEWFSYPVYNFTELRKKLDSETVCNFRKGIIIQLGYILIWLILLIK